MKLITLNTWGGKLADELRAFLIREAPTTDVFCFQEVLDQAVQIRPEFGQVDKELFATLSKLLPAFSGLYASSQKNDEGLAIFVRSTIPIDAEGDVFVHRHRDAMVGNDGRTLGRNLQYVQLQHGGDTYTVMNLHGIWNGGPKTDTPDRIQQSRNVRAFLDEAPGKKILCGDFNLEPMTESVAILEAGMRNLVKEYGVTSTRSHHYPKPVKFADYIIVSPDVAVERFEVLQDPVSDHLPLVLEFS